MNTSNITNYKPKEFAKLLNVTVKTLRHSQDTSSQSRHFNAGTVSILHVFSCRLYGLRKYKKQIEGDETIAQGVQNGDSPN